MEWQDIILSIGQIVFIIALLPSVFSKDKPALATSVITGITLMIFAFTYATLSLTNAAISAVIVSLLWFVLAIQKYKQQKDLIKTTKENQI